MKRDELWNFFLTALGSPLAVMFPILTTSSFTSGKICCVILVETRELSHFGFLGVSVVTWGAVGPQS